MLLRAFPRPSSALGSGCADGSALMSPDHPLSKLFMGHHVTLQHQGCSAASTITSLLELDHGAPFSQVCFGEGAEVCTVSVCRFHSLMVHQHLLGRGWLCSAGRCSWDSPAVSVARPLGMGTWICDCTGGYISCGNCFPPLQGWLIRKSKGPELVQACMGMSGSFSDAPEHPLSQVGHLS